MMTLKKKGKTEEDTTRHHSCSSSQNIRTRSDPSASPAACTGRKEPISDSIGLSAPPLGYRRCSRGNPRLPGLRFSDRGGISVEPPWSHRKLLLRCPGRPGRVGFEVDARRLRRHCCDVRRDWCFRSPSRPRVVLPLAVAVVGDRWWGVKPGERADGRGLHFTILATTWISLQLESRLADLACRSELRGSGRARARRSRCLVVFGSSWPIAASRSIIRSWLICLRNQSFCGILSRGIAQIQLCRVAAARYGACGRTWRACSSALLDTMSRCFPFPPPGYEAKPRSEHKDLLKKENHKAKKHKKEKTDGGKRERKEKDPGHRKDKHKKKLKREKHKYRREKKERDKDKRQNLELGTQKNDDLDNRRPKQIVHNEAVKYSKHKDELATQITGQEGHANHARSNTRKLLPRSIESFGVAGSKEKERTSISRGNGKSRQIAQHNHASEKGKNRTRILNGTSLQLGSAEKRYTIIHGSSGVGLQQESSKGIFVTTTASEQKCRTTPSANAAQETEQVDQHPDGSSQSAYGKSDSVSTNFHFGVDKQSARGKSGADQGIAKIKEAKANHQKSVKDGDRRHDANQKVVKDRDRDRSVKKRKAKYGNESKAREKRSTIDEQKRRELDGHEASKNYIHDLMDSAHLNGNKFTSDDVKKRKGLNTNSPLHDHRVPMTKMPRTSPTNHVCMYGEMLKHSQGTTRTLPVGTHPREAEVLEDSKERCNNGITGPHHLEEHNSAVSPSSYGSSEVSLRPPHPDTKYLSQVYSIPAADNPSEYVDQDWLCSGDRVCVHQKTTKFEAAEAPQVWAEAQLIDSADVVALPYVVPL